MQLIFRARNVSSLRYYFLFVAISQRGDNAAPFVLFPNIDNSAPATIHLVERYCPTCEFA